MKTQPSRDVDKESEYLAMAAQIIYIKSKSLVPPVEIDGEEINIQSQAAFMGNPNIFCANQPT